jgi:hypothetical protein
MRTLSANRYKHVNATLTLHVAHDQRRQALEAGLAALHQLRRQRVEDVVDALPDLANGERIYQLDDFLDVQGRVVGQSGDVLQLDLPAR